MQRVPPPIDEDSIAKAYCIVSLAAKNPRPRLASFPELLQIIYRPLQNLQFSDLQYDMLFWDNDKLNLFPNLGLEHVDFENFKQPISPSSFYSRRDENSVFGIVYDTEYSLVFSNELTQISWQLIGIFKPQCTQEELQSVGWSIYETYESNYKKLLNEVSQNSSQTSESDEENRYWNSYFNDEDKKIAPALEENSDNSDAYWDQYDETVCAIEPRPFAIEIIKGLIDLYKDCGITELREIRDDLVKILHEGVHSNNIASKHALRTIKTLKQDKGDESIMDEVSMALST